MIYPKFLEKDNLIGVPAPSSGSYNEQKTNKILNAKKRFESLGYKVQLSDNYDNCIMGRSSEASIRAQEINEMFSSKDINALICLAGGEFLVEILPYVDFELIKENPKLITGFSDPTGLLYPITTKYDIATIYGQNFSSLGNANLYTNQEQFLEIIKGNIVKQESMPYYEEEYVEAITGLEDYNLTEKVYWHTLDDKPAMVKGRLIGGCLDIITELAGTKYDGVKEFNEKYKNDGIIWYFDNCELSMEETIRTLWKLNELEYFKYAKGIIFGRFGKPISYMDYDTKTCLLDSVLGKLNIPIIYDADVSHKAPCLTFINGAVVTITAENGKAEIIQELI